MDAVLGKGVLRGRSFGGLAMFVRLAIINNLEIIHLSDRVIVLKVNNILTSNVYMPCNDNEFFVSILGIITDVIDKNVNNVDHLIVAGDFNLSFAHASPTLDSLRHFWNSCRLFNTHDLLSILSILINILHSTICL